MEVPNPETQGDVADEGSAQRERRELLIARRHERLLGVFADATDGIVEWKEPTPLPGAGASVRGLVSVRGRMFTVIDPTWLLATEVEGESSEARFIVLLAGDEQLALAVERVVSITEVFVDEIEMEDQGTGINVVSGHWRDGDYPVPILEPSRIFAAASGLSF